MRAVIFLYGVPGVGKSTLMRSLLAHFGPSDGVFRVGLLHGICYPLVRTIVLGSYTPGEVFAGTDRLSMGIQQSAPLFWKQLTTTPEYHDWAVVGEGSRISTKKFIECAARFHPVTLYQLVADPEVIEMRRAARSLQSEIWLRGMRSRMANLAALYPHTLLLKNDFPQDSVRNTRILLDAVEGRAHTLVS